MKMFSVLPIVVMIGCSGVAPSTLFESDSGVDSGEGGITNDGEIDSSSTDNEEGKSVNNCNGNVGVCGNGNTVNGPVTVN